MAVNLCVSPKCKWVGSPSTITLDGASSGRLSSLGSSSISSSKNGNNINNIASSVSLSFSTNTTSVRKSASVTVRSSLETAGPTVTVGQVTEVNKDTFWPIVKAAGDKTVVLDMYTQWCGPCKVMAPKFQELSEKYLDVVFLKLDCNQDNKPLAKELGIKVVPTFKILKDSNVVKEVTGAKFDDLVIAIDTVRST
ncbi:thioredoxin F-type, chloroplastic-like [Gastrolobium bilobum]|uniref:thioredoxin F-type, chloroplastic-like n=1 Tax=Gastrolobium bilobum TaxID=150636 RepID=UPI002AAF7512|nr:thioredoxin F-type, chloroplastic-like [Gastrolobium bilobum]